MKINEITQRILASSTTAGKVLFLPEQLERSEYLNVNKVLTALGGKWNRKEKGHVFDFDPEDIIEQVVLTGEYTDMKKEFQFFETPEELAAQLCDMAEITPECTCLEPSAGKGRIANEIMRRKPKSLLCMELNKDMEQYLEHGGYPVIYDDFLEFSEKMLATDRIVMNPPFSRQQDIDHVYKAYSVLKPGGILVSVMSVGFMYRANNEKSKRFREFLTEHNAETTILPTGTFKESGTMVNACIIKIRKDD